MVSSSHFGSTCSTHIRRSRALFFVPSLALIAIASGSSALAQATIHVPADQPTIQDGINAANNGDTVLVAPGTYYENIDFKGKAITVTGIPGDAASTIIDGGGTAATVTFQSGEARGSVISGFTIRDGGYAAGTGDYAGGGIYVSNAAPTILRNVITANIDHCIEVEYGAALIEGNELSDTLGAGTAFFDGTGVILFGSSKINGLPNSVLVGNTIENNLSSPGSGGGGIVIWAAEGSVIQGNIIRNNAATDTGGGIASYNADNISIVDNLIYGNSATITAGILNSSGGISLSPPGSTQGPFIGIVAGNTVAGNTVSAAGPQPGEIGEQVSLEGNLAQYVMVDNIVAGSSGSLPAMNCGVAGNSLSITPLVFDHNDIYNSQGAAYSGACPDQTGMYGNISADPAFANAGSGNYQLAGGSPAVDAGNNSAPQMPAMDIAGSTRIQDATGKGYPVVDMGAYELAGQQDAAPTILTLTPSAYLINGTTLTLAAQLTSAAGAPTGSVAFFEDGSQIGTGNLDSTGAASFVVPSMTAGIHALTATYSGQGAFPPAVSVKFYVLVQAYAAVSSTTTAVSSSLNPSPYGQSVTFTATVANTSATTPGAPTGSVTFSDGATSLGTFPLASAGANAATAQLSTSSLSVGMHNITAAYTPSGSFSPSNGSLQQSITGLATGTALGSSLNPANVGQAVTFTATVTNTGSAAPPTGSIIFSDGATVLGSVPVAASGANSAAASFTAGALAAGTHTITAAYAPTGAFAASSAQLTETIHSTPTLTPDFTITLASPTITLQTQHHTTTSITLASVNGFADSLALSCANLPQYVTCRPTPNPASLAANGTVAVALYLDTDSVLGYARLTAPASPMRRSPPISLALLLSPFSLFGALTLSRKSRHAPLRLLTLRLVVIFLALLPVSLALSGCGEIIFPYDPPNSAAPGAYTIPITAVGATTHISHTANLTLIITP